MKRILTFAVGACAAAELSAAVPEVEVTEVGQDARRVVTVGYTLSAPAVVTVDFLTNGVSLLTEDAKVQGDVGWVTPAGSKTVTWRPRKELPSGLELKDVTVRVEAYSSARQPDYLVLDLANGVRRYYATSNDVPGGVLGNPDYREKYVLMRRIPVAWKEQAIGRPNSSWSVSSKERRAHHVVMLTNDFYMAVFPMTRGQLARAYGWTDPKQDVYRSRDEENWRLRPATGMSYDDLRGSEADGIDWPNTGDAVAEGSILDRFRDQTGVLLDLPTDAQYEIATRAGDAGDTYTGYFALRVPAGKAASDVTDYVTAVKKMGWYKDNWDEDTVTVSNPTGANFTHIVGLKAPNAYGLYDTCGNVRQLCRDWFMTAPGTAKDGYVPDYYEPRGPTKESADIIGFSPTVQVPGRASHSCSYSESADLMMTSARNPQQPGGRAETLGFRLVCPALHGGAILK